MQLLDETCLDEVLNCYISAYLKCNKTKLATEVEGDLKAPFSLATTQRCWRRRNFFPLVAPLYRWSILYNAVC